MMIKQGVLVGLTLEWSYLTCPAEVTAEKDQASSSRINPPSTVVKSVARTVGKHMTGLIAATVNVYSGKQGDRNRDTYERIWLESFCEGNGRGVHAG